MRKRKLSTKITKIELETIQHVFDNEYAYQKKTNSKREMIQKATHNLNWQRASMYSTVKGLNKTRIEQTHNYFI